MSPNTFFWTVFMLCLSIHQSLKISNVLRSGLPRRSTDYGSTPCKTEELCEGGKCMSASDCNTGHGINLGACGRSSLICCTFKFTCTGKTSLNNTIFVNPTYPLKVNRTNTCEVTIQNAPNICQLRLDFEMFSLSPPDEYGRCTKDKFVVRTTVGEPLPILCGENEGQHMYVNMGRGSGNPMVLSVTTNGTDFSRIWKIMTSYIPCNNNVMAPSGCLQYYFHGFPYSGVIRSFNYKPKVEMSRSLSNLTYNSCIRVEKNFCAIKWQTEEANSFSRGASNNPLFNTLNVSFTAVNNKVVKSRSKPFLLKVRPNSVFTDNVKHSKNSFSLRYVQLPCVN